MKADRRQIGIGIYLLVSCLLIVVTYGVSAVVTAVSEQQLLLRRKCIIIDAGHGYPDGGTTSCSGVLECEINLEIAKKLDDLCHLLGLRTIMIRTDAQSVYTEGNTIAAKKISDLKERVRIVNSTPQGILVSIHQNYFSQNKYTGSQVFYSEHPDAQLLAESLQKAFSASLQSENKRSAKKSSGIYLLEKIQRPGVLVECGFLSNPIEDQLLQNDVYQRKLCSVIASVCSNYLASYTAS